MGPSPTYHPPEGEECETLVEHGLPLWAEPAVGYCSWRPRPSPMWGSRFVRARAAGLWVGVQKPLGKSPLRGNPSPESTYLPTSTRGAAATALIALGLGTYLICALGDRDNFDCLRRSYDRVRALAPVTQLLVKHRPTLAAAGSMPSFRIVLCRS